MGEPFSDNRVRALSLATSLAGCNGDLTINLTERLDAIDCSVLVIVGEDEHGTPVAMAREIHGQILGSQLVVLLQAAHLANLEQPQALKVALPGFLNWVGG